jgi:ABC-2 type transport system permease protein
MSGFSNVAAIFQKEWRHYFGSPIAYVALCAWTLLFGAFFVASLSFFIDQTARMGPEGSKASLNEWLIRGLFHNTYVVAMFFAPMFTMRLFAEEKRQGTMELLSTLPLTDLQIVLGKFFAAVAVYALMLAASLLNLIVLWVYSTPKPEWKPVATGALGLLLMGSCFIALGTFLSNLTKNQMVAGILSFCMVLGLLILGWMEDPMAGPVKKVIAYLAVTAHFQDFVKGVINVKDIVFYLTFAGFGVFLAHQSVASQRWRT